MEPISRLVYGRDDRPPGGRKEGDVEESDARGSGPLRWWTQRFSDRVETGVVEGVTSKRWTAAKMEQRGLNVIIDNSTPSTEVGTGRGQTGGS